MKKLLIALMVAGLVVAFTAPAFSAETFGGRVRWNYGYTADSEELTDNGEDAIVSGFMSVSSSSYFRVTFESKDKLVGVRIEIGLGSTVTRRPVFGWYTMGNCKIVAGNNYTWAGDGVMGAASWLIDPTTGGFGMTYHGRRPMIAIEWRSGNFGLQVGLFEPQMDLGYDDFRWVLPTLNVTLDAKFGSIQVAPAFGITHYLWEADSGDDSLVAWFIGVPAKFTFGPVDVKVAFMYSVNGSADYGQNALAAPVMAANGDIEDSKSYGGWLEVGYSAGAVSVHLGAAFVTIDNDTFAADDVTQFKYYVHMQYKLHKNLVIRPEIGFIDYADDQNDAEAGSSFQLGLRFQFVF
jgi:hypothetical protein